MSQYSFAIDENGAPMLTVEAPVEETTEVEKPDPGKGSDARRRDAVVDASRTLDDLSSAGVEALVRRRWRGDRPVTQADIETFATDARTQRVDDVVDALDFRIRRAVYGRAGTKQVHVSIPRGITRKSLASIEAEDMGKVFQRLRAKGWNNQQIMRHGVRRFDKDRTMREMLK